MKKQIESVHKFHTAFKLGMNSSPVAHITERRNQLRFELMKEENEEYLEAAQNNDLVEVADALGDMLYILCGTIIEHGMLKGPSYFKPNFEQILKKTLK